MQAFWKYITNVQYIISRRLFTPLINATGSIRLLPLLHRCPVHPVKQLHENDPSVLKHVPLFSHGLIMHSFISVIKIKLIDVNIEGNHKLRHGEV